MNHIYKMFGDLILGFLEGIERLKRTFQKKPVPSLVALNIEWCTNSSWMDRLVSYKQLDLWTLNK